MKLSNSTGKVLTIFLVIIAILLITLTALSMFFYNVEIDRRKEAETSVASIQKDFDVMKNELKTVKKKNFLLEEKNKEADNRINSLLDEIDLEKGLREEVKKETLALKVQIDNLKKERQKIEDQSATLYGDYEQKIVELEAKLKVELNRNQELVQQNTDLMAVRDKLEQMNKQAQKMAPTSRKAPTTAPRVKKPAPKPIPKKDPVKPAKADTPPKTTSSSRSSTSPKVDVELDKIVVTPRVSMGDDEIMNEIIGEATSSTAETTEGRVLSVDVETEFVVINLGEEDGLFKGSLMSVYRGNEYLGDIIITRTQAEMAAADLIPPLSSKMIRKNDQVIVK